MSSPEPVTFVGPHGLATATLLAYSKFHDIAVVDLRGTTCAALVNVFNGGARAGRIIANIPSLDPLIEDGLVERASDGIHIYLTKRVLNALNMLGEEESTIPEQG